MCVCICWHVLCCVGVRACMSAHTRSINPDPSLFPHPPTQAPHNPSQYTNTHTISTPPSPTTHLMDHQRPHQLVQEQAQPPQQLKQRPVLPILLAARAVRPGGRHFRFPLLLVVLVLAQIRATLIIVTVVAVAVVVVVGGQGTETRLMQLGLQLAEAGEHGGACFWLFGGLGWWVVVFFLGGGGLS